MATATPAAPAAPSRKAHVEIGLVNANNIGTFKKLTEAVLPTRYPDDFYALDKEGTVLKLAYFNEVSVGCVKARLSYKEGDTKLPRAVYIDAIAVLEPYRSLGVGSKLLEFVEEDTSRRFVHEIGIHVQKSDEKAVTWYKSKGFETFAEIKDYYKAQGLQDADAVYMTKKV